MTASRRVHHDPAKAPMRAAHLEPSPRPVGVLPLLVGVIGLIPAGLLVAYVAGGAA